MGPTSLAQARRHRVSATMVWPVPGTLKLTHGFLPSVRCTGHRQSVTETMQRTRPTTNKGQNTPMIIRHNRLHYLCGVGMLFLLCLLTGWGWVAQAQADPPVHPDGWDLSFGGDGKLETGCLGTGKITVSPVDDKFIVAVKCNGEHFLQRYLPNGEIDLSFGANGRIATTYGREGLFIIQTDSKLIAADGLRLTRFHNNGNVDRSFGVNGIADPFAISDENNQITQIALQQDGKIVATGTKNQQPLIVRYTTEGQLDPTFYGQGYRLLENHDFGQVETWEDLAIQPDGKLVVGLTAVRLIDPFYAIYDNDALIARYNVDGSLDQSFGSGGWLNYGQQSDPNFFGSILIQPDGKLLAFLGVGGQNSVVRLLPSGADDDSFSFTSHYIDADLVEIDQANRIVLLYEYGAYRLLPEGSVDQSFGKSGMISNHYDWWSSLKLQSDGRILMSSGNSIIDADVMVIRYDDNRPTPTATPTEPHPTYMPTPFPTPTPTPTPLSPEQRSLALIYTVLDNNLGSEWTRLVNNIEAGAHPGVDVRLLIDGPATGDAYVYTIQPDRNPYCPTIENPTCDGRYSEGYNYQRFFTEDTARPHALYQFLVDSFNAYRQAPQISLTIIGHGSGWGANALPAQPSIWRDQNDTLGGMLWDDHTGVQAGSRSLSTLALGQAIHWATSETNRTLNLLYLDGCSMGMTEVAYELRNRADYLLASPNTDWATFAYDQLLPLVRYERDGRALGEAWLAAEAALMRSRTGYPFTLALTDLRRITPLATTVTAFADALQGVVPTQRAAITLAYQQSDRFDSNYDATLDSNDNYLDLHDFAAQVQSSGITDTLVISHAQAVQTLLSSVVITVAQQNGSPWLAEEQTWAWRNLGGLSLYAPLQTDEAKRRIYYTKDHLAWAADSSWDEFLTTFWADIATAATPSDELPVCYATTQNCAGLANPLPVQPPQLLFMPIVRK